MTPDLQASGSTKYIAAPYVIIPVSAGFHIYSGYGSVRDFIAAVTADDLPKWLTTDYQEKKEQNILSAARRPKPITISFDLSDFQL